jgi:hypothetical protein
MSTHIEYLKEQRRIKNRGKGYTATNIPQAKDKSLQFTTLKAKLANMLMFCGGVR